ncbi:MULTISPECIES: TonB-dependent receptor [Prevotella]|uniref:Membrane protein n=1 Tax=Prevotella herbatica TaxID=2801997 RepID=A0ABM7NYL5_9BACT|nr:MULTISPECIES: TonB-dependent receptor [Prevotella]MDN5552713.1 TonB-dependent receptor [Prevotella sp.]BCS85520.1 membrane protein [Prevotella herbatica]
MKKATTIIVLLLTLILYATNVSAQSNNNNTKFTVNLKVAEKGSHEAIMMASCNLNPLSSFAITDVDGKTSFKNVPQGRYVLEISYVGYEKYQTTIDVKSNLSLAIQMTPTSLALKEVVVTARQKSSIASTTSVIGRQAIDHLQATSLADIMQLIPGKEMGNTDLTQQSNLQLRTLSNNNTSAFGSSIIIDGVPMSNNAAMTQGGFSSTAFTGTDLRQVSADNIDNVEVVRGIPSAEYGDLTSGLVIVHSKMGVTPWQFKGKVNPELQNYSLGKGFNLNKAGILNFNFDYAKAWSDPRQKTRSYGRYSLNIGYAYDISKKWHTDTKLRFMYTKDWNGKDPDAIADGTSSSNKNYTFGLTHNGRLSLDKLFMRTLSYTLGVSMTKIDNSNTSYISSGSGLLPIITAMQTGYYNVPWMTKSYLATGITESRPGNIFAKINDSFYFKAGKTRQSFKIGADYSLNWNSGRGYYNENDSLPYRPNSNGRPRAFSSIPALHQIAAYAEDNFTWNINKINYLRANIGLRFTSQQPFSNVSTTSLSPRINLSFSATKWLDIRGGIGLNSKTPGLDYLYPDRKYDDRVAANYMPQNDAAAQLLAYHTQVYNVEYSKGLKNATTTKIELGLDLKLPGNRKLSLLAYRDKTPNGFGSATEYFTYASNVYTAQSGLVITPGAATTINYDSPARQDLIFMTTGRVGNTNTTVNKGIEFDFELGEIKPINTSIFFSGAYSETKSWSTDMNSRSVAVVNLPTSYSSYNTTPFKVVYPSGLDYNMYRRFINTLRLVTNIPSLRMVASFTAQAIWYDYSRSFVAKTSPIGYITPDLAYHDITNDMQSGYLDMTGKYFSSMPSNTSIVKISDLNINPSDAVPTKSPITWNLSGRLTKELGNIGGLSLYVNNMMYYEPYLKSSTTTTLSQRNTNTFSYGVELYFNL